MNELLIRWTSGLTLAAAAWLVLSPLWISYSSSGTMWTQIVIGIIVGLLALTKMASPRAAWPSSLNFVAGIWFIIMPWVMTSSTAVKWNAVVLGAIVAVLAVVELISTSGAPAATDTELSSREQSMAFGERIDRQNRR